MDRFLEHPSTLHTYNLVPGTRSYAASARVAEVMITWYVSNIYSSPLKNNNMVTITAFHQVERKDGSTFISLELTGQAELIQSQTTGKWYATVRRCRIPSTFDANIAKAMIGQRLPGQIVKVICPEYTYLNKTTGEVLTLNHSYAYSQDPTREENLVGHTPVMELA